jgi:phosphosulfolactate synthase (CoM biosynthesis protein A)
MDNVAPKTGITFKSPQFFNRDTLFINKETKIKLFAGDYESGVQKTEYSIDGGAFQNYTEEINVLAEGFHTIKFRSTDMVNNIETEKTSTCLVDNNAPDIFVNFSIQATGQNQKDGKNYDVYPSYTQLYVAATDRYSGTEKIYFQINNGAKQLYVSAREIAQKGLLSKEGFYSVKLTAVDKLGNENEKVIEFFISGK